ncbi:MAG: PDZ domain-containing protein [bacterium]|nr:PDZ domain-containing protein [bacterium]
MTKWLRNTIGPALAVLATAGIAHGAMAIDEGETDDAADAQIAVLKCGQGDGETFKWTTDGKCGKGIAAAYVIKAEDGDGQVIELTAGEPGNMVFVGDAGEHAATVTVTVGAGDPSRGWLGVSLEAVSPAMAAQLGLKDSGIMIGNVVKDSPAAEAGLERFDVIVSVNGKTVDGSLGALAERIGELGPGVSADLTVIRGGRGRSVTVTLDSRPAGETIEWEYEWTGGPSIKERFQTHGRVILRAPDGELQIHELGDLKALKELPESVRKMLPDIGDITTNVWVGKDHGSINTHIVTRIEEDGETLEIEQEDGQITVRRTEEDASGNTTTTENTYDSADALEAADPDAFEVYSRIQGPHVIDLDLGGFKNLHLDLDDLHQDAAKYRVMVRDQIGDATKAYTEALKCFDGAKAFKDLQFGQGNKFAFFGAGQVNQSFDVRPDGSIEIRLQKGDTEVVLNYSSEDDLAKRNPEMYEKFADVLDAAAEN